MQYLHGVRKNRCCEIEILPWEYSSKGYRVSSYEEIWKESERGATWQGSGFWSHRYFNHIYKVSGRDLRWTWANDLSGGTRTNSDYFYQNIENLVSKLRNKHESLYRISLTISIERYFWSKNASAVISIWKLSTQKN